MKSCLLIIVYASSVAFVKVYRLGLTARFQVALNKLYVKTQDPWISLLVNSCLCYCISLQEGCNCRGMFVYHGYECLTDPRLSKLIIVVSRFRELFAPS